MRRSSCGVRRRPLSQLPQTGYASFVQYLAGKDGAFEANDNMLPSAMRFARKNRCLSSSVRNFVDEISSAREFGLRCRIQNLPASAITPTRAALRIWAYCPICCPAMFLLQPRHNLPTNTARALPAAPGLDLVEMFDAAGRGDLSALYVVGSNPVARYGIDPRRSRIPFSSCRICS